MYGKVRYIELLAVKCRQNNDNVSGAGSSSTGNDHWLETIVRAKKGIVCIENIHKVRTIEDYHILHAQCMPGINS